MIRVKQIDPAELAAAVAQYSTGSVLSGAIVAYVSASGWLGNGVVTVTGAQDITGVKRFLDSPRVPYYGGTGAAPTALYVTDQDALISGALVTRVANLSGFAINTISGALSAVRVTGSTTIPIVNLTGLNGTTVLWSGGWVFISASGAGGGGSSNTSVTGSSAISAPNFTGNGSVVVTYDGTYVRVSGASSIDPILSGYLENNFVHRGLFTEPISGLKTFTGALGVGNPTTTGHAINLNLLLLASGSLTGSIGAMTGYNVYNTFNITGTGSITNNLSATGNMTNIFNVSGNVTNGNTTIIGTITGNFVDISFFADPVATGLNLFEAHVAHSFIFTGAAFACRTSGFGPVNGGVLSGKLYQVDSNNTEQTLYAFAFQSGSIYSGATGFNVFVTGRNRVGVSITNGLSGIEKLSIGVFGSSYV